MSTKALLTAFLGAITMTYLQAIVYKNIIFDIGDVLFTHHPYESNMHKLFSPIKEGIAILHCCHQQIDGNGQKKYKLFVLSNYGTRGITILKQEFADIMNLFDGIVTPAQTHTAKPNSSMYRFLLEQYSLNPQESIFIDDKHNHVKAAEELGMTGIICQDFTKVKEQLQLLGIL